MNNADADRPTDHDFAPLRPVAGPRRFHELGTSSIVEWQAPGQPSGTRDFQSLRGIRGRLEHEPSLRPSLFIFHCSRCGSTLLGRLLEQDPGMRVCLEPDALLQFFELNPAPENDPGAIERFRTLLQAYGLSPRPSERHLVIKFASLNIRQVEFVRACFPDVELVYLLREPAAVLASILRRPPRFLDAMDRTRLASIFGQPAKAPGDHTFAEWCGWYVEQNLSWALEWAGLFRQVIDYRDWRKEYFTLLSRFSAQPRNIDEPGFAPTLARHAKRRSELFTPESSPAAVPPMIGDGAEAVYRRWRAWCDRLPS